MGKREILSPILFFGIIGIIVFSSFIPINVIGSRIDPGWYYDYFTAADRKKIRQAIDYAIPRDQIIDDLMQGFAVPVATPLLPTHWGYNSTIVPRKSNQAKALDLMEEVFGYRYNISASTTEYNKPYFQTTLFAPHTRQDQIQWAADITDALREIGIEVTLRYLDWNGFISRIFNPTLPGADFDHGGHDGYFFGWDIGPDPDLTCWFLRAARAPSGCNAHFIEHFDVEKILNRTLIDPNATNRLTALEEFQQWFYNEVPFHMILQEVNMFVFDPDLKGVDTSGLLYPNYGNWTHPNQISVAVHSPGQFYDLNPILSNSYFDKLATGGLYEGLLGQFPGDLEIWHGILADRWTHTPDNLVWEVSIKDGIKFSDGSDLTVDDVVFSYQQLLNPDVRSARRGEFIFFDEDAVEKINATTARFAFNTYYPYAQNYLSSVPVLSKTEMAQINGSEWKVDPTNTQRAPLGTGPYQMQTYSAANQRVILVKNPYYDETLRGHDPTKQVWFPNPSFDTIVIKYRYYDDAAANIALQNSDMDIIDPHTFLIPYLDTINGSTWGTINLSPSYRFQALFLNQYNPIWGLNPHDPRVMYAHGDEFPEPPIILVIIFLIFLVLIFGPILFVLYWIVWGRRRETV